MFKTAHTVPMIHDCDPGPDDSLALMLSFASPNWRVAGITTVGGNAGVEECTRNARKIAALCGHKVPVHKGLHHAGRDGRVVTLEDMFTVSGLPGAEDLPDPGPDWTPTQDAVSYLVETLGAENAPPHLVCATGPLTNIAAALEREPRIVRAIKRLVLMGGCVFPEPIRGEMGNYKVAGTDGKAEFNFAIDPGAAAAVLGSDIKDISLIGLNVTRKVLFNAHWRDRFLEIGNPVAMRAAEFQSRWRHNNKSDLGHLWRTADDIARAVHDAVAVVYIDHPQLFESRRVHVRVVTDPPPAVAGLSLPAQAEEAGASRHPIDVVTDADTDKVFEAMCERLAAYDRMAELPAELD